LLCNSSHSNLLHLQLSLHCQSDFFHTPTSPTSKPWSKSIDYSLGYTNLRLLLWTQLSSQNLTLSPTPNFHPITFWNHPTLCDFQKHFILVYQCDFSYFISRLHLVSFTTSLNLTKSNICPLPFSFLDMNTSVTLFQLWMIFHISYLLKFTEKCYHSYMRKT